MKQLFEATNGSGPTKFAWSPNGQYLAVSGTALRVQIFDRHGELHDEIPLAGKEKTQTAVTHFAWCSRSEQLAVLHCEYLGKDVMATVGADAAFVYRPRQKESTKIDNSQRHEFTHCGWDPNGVTLAFATGKGNVLTYDSHTTKMTSILGKHTEKIGCGSWSPDGRLILGGDDKVVTVSSKSGDTEIQLEITHSAKSIVFSPEPPHTAASLASGSFAIRTNQFSVDVGRKTLLVYRLGESGEKYESEQHRLSFRLGKDHPPDELSFQTKYGKIAAHVWLTFELLLVGFDTGYLVLMSTGNAEELREEKFSAKAFEAQRVVKPEMPGLIISWCPSANRIAAGLGSVFKLFDVTRDLRLTESAESMTQFGNNVSVTEISWNNSGQVVSIGTDDGRAQTFLASLPQLASSKNTRTAYLSSLKEVSVIDLAHNDAQAMTTVPLQHEPSYLALGDAHVSCGMNNQAWFYNVDNFVDPETNHTSNTPQLVNQREYMGVVDQIAMADVYAIALCEGRGFVHAIDARDDPNETNEFSVPERGETQRVGYVTCVAATASIAVYGTATGYVRLISVTDRGVCVGEHRHDEGITGVYPNQNGTRVIFVDDTNVPTLYDPVGEKTWNIPHDEHTAHFQSEQNTLTVLWDVFDPDVFTIADGYSFRVYTYSPVSIDGPQIQFVGVHPQQPGSTPVSLVDGTISWQNSSSQIASEVLITHDAVLSYEDYFVKGHGAGERFARAISLNKLQVAWEVAIKIRSPEMWEQLAHKAMTSLSIEFAIRVYRFVGDASMVLSLERLLHVEDTNQLAANVLMLFERPECYDAAQVLFIKSNRHKEALQMRIDLKHWDAATDLANRFEQSKLDDISREHACALESRGEIETALEMFESALTHPNQSSDEIKKAKAGIARCSVRLGDVKRGKQLCSELDDADVSRDCAFLLEQYGNTNDAAIFFEKAGSFENAASIYLDEKKFADAKSNLDRVVGSSAAVQSLHARYASAMELAGKFSEAVQSYELARNFVAAVRVLLSLLKPSNPHAAFQIVRSSRSPEAASLAASYCRQIGDTDNTIEFLLLARKSDDAFALASEVGGRAMDKLSELLGPDGGVPEEYRKLATYFESVGSCSKAGDNHCKAGRNEHAVRCYLKQGDEVSVQAAIDLVGSVRDDNLTTTVVDFLSTAGESTSTYSGSINSKKPTSHTAWLFKLHVALGDYDAAAKTTVLLARQEQEMGNYKNAHAQLFDSIVELRKEGKEVSVGVSRQLTLLHSYILVKSFVRQKDREGAARLLCRVARSISKFPAHMVPILSSTVVECTRAGLKKTAIEFAQRLMAPELRKEIVDTYKRKIETVARKPDPDAEDIPEPNSSCPFCDASGGAYDMTCNACQSDVPCCMASGMRVTKEEWTHCPACHFPCNRDAFIKIVMAEGGECPMCRDIVDAESVVAGSGAEKGKRG